MCRIPSLILGIPGDREARAESAVERIVGVLLAGADVVDGGEAQGRIVYRTGERRFDALRHVIGRIHLGAVLIHHRYLLGVIFVRRHFELIAETVGEGHARLDVPGIREVGVVVRNHAVRHGAGTDRSEREVGTGARVDQLRLAHHTHYVGVIGIEVTRLAGRHAGRVIEAAEVDVGRGDLVSQRVIDTLAVIGAGMNVAVLLIGTANLDQVVALDDGHIIFDQAVLAVPKTGTGALRVDVVRDQRVGAGGLTADFDRAGEAGQLRHIAAGEEPLPVIARIVPAEIVGDRGRDGAGQAEHPEARASVCGARWRSGCRARHRR